MAADAALLGCVRSGYKRPRVTRVSEEDLLFRDTTYYDRDLSCNCLYCICTVDDCIQ